MAGEAMAGHWPINGRPSQPGLDAANCRSEGGHRWPGAAKMLPRLAGAFQAAIVDVKLHWEHQIYLKLCSPIYKNTFVVAVSQLEPTNDFYYLFSPSLSHGRGGTTGGRWQLARVKPGHGRAWPGVRGGRWWGHEWVGAVPEVARRRVATLRTYRGAWRVRDS